MAGRMLNAEGQIQPLLQLSVLEWAEVYRKLLEADIDIGDQIMIDFANQRIYVRGNAAWGGWADAKAVIVLEKHVKVVRTDT